MEPRPSLPRGEHDDTGVAATGAPLTEATWGRASAHGPQVALRLAAASSSEPSATCDIRGAPDRHDRTEQVLRGPDSRASRKRGRDGREHDDCPVPRADDEPHFMLSGHTAAGSSDVCTLRVRDTLRHRAHASQQAQQRRARPASARALDGETGAAAAGRHESPQPAMHGLACAASDTTPTPVTTAGGPAASGDAAVKNLSHLKVKELDSIAFLSFLRHHGARVERLPGGHLRLPEGMVWPASGTRTMHVRRAYVMLYESVLHRCRPQQQQDRDNQHVIMGHPGIGKSVFGWYVMFRLLTEDPPRPVLYVDAADSEAYLVDKAGAVWSTAVDALKDLVKHAVTQYRSTLSRTPEGAFVDLGPAVTVVADSLLPRAKDTPHPVVVLASTNRVRLQFDTSTLRSYAKLHMPVPTEDEIRDMARVAFSGVCEGVEARMQLWGPIPRLALSPIDHSIEAWAAINAQDEAQLVRALGCLRGDDPLQKAPLPHPLVVQHAAGQYPNDTRALFPGPLDMSNAWYYRPGRRSLPSPALLRWAVSKAKSHTGCMIKLLLDCSSRPGPLGALRGLTFQQVALRILQAGGRFKRHRMLPSRRPALSATTLLHVPEYRDADDFELRRSECIATFAHRGELASKAGPGVFLVPESSSDAGSVSFMWDDHRECYACVQAVVGTDASINGEALAASLAALGWVPGLGMPRHKVAAESEPRHAELRFYWVVLEDAMTALNAWCSCHRIIEGGDPRLEAEMEQFVVGIPPPIAADLFVELAAELPDPEELMRRGIALG